MPTAIVSSVKHPDGIYLTAGQWTRIEPSPRFESPPLLVSLHPLVLFVFPSEPCTDCSHLRPILPPPEVPLRPPSAATPDQLRRRRRRCLVHDACLINEEPGFLPQRGPWSRRGAK